MKTASTNMAWISYFKRNWLFYSTIKLFIFVTAFRLVTPSQNFNKILQNPGKGVNFYGKLQNIPRSQEQSAKKAFNDLVHPRCSKSSDVSRGVRELSYHYPGIVCQIEDPVQCNYSYPYRTFDGTCNNPHISRLGMVNQCFERFLPAYYEGDGNFRRSAKGGPLPEPRDITLQIFKDRKRPTVNVTFQFATFGEFIAVDTLLAVRPPTDCCSEKNKNKPGCMPISLPSDDPFYSQFNKTCISFHRTVQCDCNTPQRAQTNGVTAAIDLSHLYSPSEKRSKELRTMDGTGRLNFTDSNVGCLLPSGKGPNDLFCPKGEAASCFMSGDPRVNHHATITSLLTIFMREHNRLATALKQMNSQWGEEKLFQEARKIVIAELQVIVYQEFLPVLLSPRIMNEFNLTVQPGSNGIRYDSSVVLGMWNEFGVATYRLHGMVPTKIGSLGLRFKDTYSNPDLIREGHLTTLINGSHFVPSEQYDRYMVKDVSEWLYQQTGVPYGKDLSAINIQRGRDHGLPPYIKIVTFCTEGAVVVSSFDDLYKLGLMSEDNANLLKQVYKAVEDIDMWVGIQLEHHMPGSPLGPSAVCINAKQFYFNQKGDRFYFDLVGPGAPFTADQRSSLKKTSFSRILCDNTDMTRIMKNPFILPSDENSPVPCNEIPEVDLSLWKDNGNSAAS